MSKIKPVLGRGLASLIPRSIPPEIQPGTPLPADDGRSEGVLAGIGLDRVDRNPQQPRADFDPVSLEELRKSIQQKGVIQPITVRRAGDRYQLISGERRVRAAREAGLREIPAYIIRVSSDEEMLELALIENLQREELNPIEIGISYRRLMEECGLTQEEVSRRIGKDRTTITNSLRLLKLPDPIQAAVRRGELSGGHARALVAVEDERKQLELFHRVMKRGLSVRDIERLVREKVRRKAKPGGSGASGSGGLSSLEEQLRQRLGTKVQVHPLRGGKGEIIIQYYSADDLDRLLELLAGS
jgi:ParB family chromosome partitioning protein